MTHRTESKVWSEQPFSPAVDASHREFGLPRWGMGENEPPRLKGHVSDASPFANLVRGGVPLSLFTCLRSEGLLGGYWALCSDLAPNMMHTEAGDDWRLNAIA